MSSIEFSMLYLLAVLSLHVAYKLRYFPFRKVVDLIFWSDQRQNKG
jgi:hypothetical protein